MIYQGLDVRIVTPLSNMSVTTFKCHLSKNCKALKIKLACGHNVINFKWFTKGSM